jgi:hypothetical protein
MADRPSCRIGGYPALVRHGNADIFSSRIHSNPSSLGPAVTLLCPQCFGDSGLQRRIVEIRPTFPDKKCDFHPRLRGVPIKEVAKIIDEVFRFNYRFAEPTYDGEGGDSLEAIIYDLTGAVEHDVVRAIIDQLIEDDDYWPPDGGEAFYNEDVNYERDDSALSTHSRLWDEFRESILHGQRFFNLPAKELLRDIFDDVHLQRSASGLRPIYVIAPGSDQASFYRARVTDTDSMRQEIEQDIAGKLGPPPVRGRRAGRMNPAGISTFYGAFDLETCIAELRPTVGSCVTGAKFAITEPLWVLDTTRFKAPPRERNIFARDYIHRAAQWRFMRRFMHEIGQPILPTDEHLDYIPTQVVAEYLLHHHEFSFAGKSGKIEAIIYRSAQNPKGKNIAILGNAARVGVLDEDKRKVEVKETEPSTPQDRWLASFGGSEKFRIAAKPQTIETRRVTGATYASNPYAGEYWSDGKEDF